jgi:hypothetical protein
MGVLWSGFLLEGDAGLVRGFEFDLVADYDRRTSSNAEDWDKASQLCAQPSRTGHASAQLQGCLLRVDASCCILDRGVHKASSIALMLQQVQNFPKNHLMSFFEA